MENENNGYFEVEVTTEPGAPEGSGRRPPSGGMPMAALICGILGIVCCGFLTSVPAIILAVLDRLRRGRFEGMALAGLICGIVGTVLSIVSAVFSATLMAEIMRELEALGYESGGL